MMTTVFPTSARRWTTSSSLRVSSRCNPVVGSSRMYRVFPVSGRASSAASLTRCALAPGKRRRGLTQGNIAEADIVQGPGGSCGSWEPRRTGPGPSRPSSSTRRRSSCRGTSRPGSRWCSAGQRRRRTSPRRRAESASRSAFAPPPRTPRTRPPAWLKLNRRAVKLRAIASGCRLNRSRIASEGPRVGDRGRGRRAPDRVLVDADHLVEPLQPGDLVGAAPASAWPGAAFAPRPSTRYLAPASFCPTRKPR